MRSKILSEQIPVLTKEGVRYPTVCRDSRLIVSEVMSFMRKAACEDGLQMARLPLNLINLEHGIKFTATPSLSLLLHEPPGATLGMLAPDSCLPPSLLTILNSSIETFILAYTAGLSNIFAA